MYLHIQSEEPTVVHSDGVSDESLLQHLDAFFAQPVDDFWEDVLCSGMAHVRQLCVCVCVCVLVLCRFPCLVYTFVV